MSQSDDFVARLARVQANSGRSVIMVGHDESFVRERKVMPQVSRRREIAGNLVYPASLAGAFLLGMFAVAFGQYVRFHLFSEGVELADSDLEMMLAGGIGLAASFVLSQMFKLSSKEHRGMQGMGVFLMVCTFHNLCHWVPGPMSAAFSNDWVAQVQTTSPTNSFRLSGRYVSWGAADAAPGADLAALIEAGIPAPEAEVAGCADAGPGVRRIVLDSDKDKTSAGAAMGQSKTIAVQKDCPAN